VDVPLTFNMAMQILQDDLSFLFRRRMLSKIYLLIKGNGIWSSRVNDELYKPRNESDIVTVIRAGSLRCLGRLSAMQEQDPCRKLTFRQPEGFRRVDRRAVRWLDSLEEDLKKMYGIN